LPDLDKVLLMVAEDISQEMEAWGPFLVKFVLPASEARVTLRLLAADNVHAATVWPGLRGVVDSMRERGGAFQWSELGERS
jgi:hypothetical protein